jgi:hypothetical protein
LRIARGLSVDRLIEQLDIPRDALNVLEHARSLSRFDFSASKRHHDAGSSSETVVS